MAVGGLGQEKGVGLYVGPEFHKLGCEWYQWQVEGEGEVAVLMQETHNDNEKAEIRSMHGAPVPASQTFGKRS